MTGTVLDTGGPVNASFDDSPPDGSPGVLFGFVGGDSARAYASWFESAALSPLAYFDTDWSQEAWTRGCPVGIPGLGTLLQYAR